jgi:hypothetical protein
MFDLLLITTRARLHPVRFDDLLMIAVDRSDRVLDCLD